MSRSLSAGSADAACLPASARNLAANARFAGTSARNISSKTSVDSQTAEARYVINAVDAQTRESWPVQADSRYKAVVELARQVGFGLEG